MKRIFLTAFAAAALVSCSNDDDNNNNGFQGTWKLTSLVMPTGWDLNNDGTANTDLMKESDCMNNSTITFGSDNMATLKMQGMDINIDENNTVTADCIDATTETSAYTVSGNNVTVTSDGEQITLTKSGNTMTTAMMGATATFKKQ